MSQKNLYTQTCDEIREKIQASNRAKGRSSSSVSRSDLDAMTLAMLNSPEHVVTVLNFSTKDTLGTGEPTGIDTRPSKRYRDSMKPMLRSMGLDKHDVDKIDDIPMSKEHAASLMGVALPVIHDYIRAGRKLCLPMTEPDETRMEISCVTAPERVSVGNRFKPNDGDSDTVTITKERAIIKAKNPVPHWLKTTK